MQRHPTFDLWLHDDAELAAVLASPLARRTVIQEGPLSRVERVECKSGLSRIYKAQARPTVEPTFYERASSPLLVGAQVLPNLADPEAPAALLLDDVRAARLAELRVPVDRALAIIDDVLRGIGEIRGDLPALGQLCTIDQWHARADAIASDLRALVAADALPNITGEFVEQFARHCRSAVVAGAFSTRMGYVHFDLLANNVLVLDHGYRVLDWQRPIWGPVDLDRASLLGRLRTTAATASEPATSLRSALADAATHDSRAFVPSGINELRLLLMIGWLAEQSRRWFPAGAGRAAALMLRLAAELPPLS